MSVDVEEVELMTWEDIVPDYHRFASYLIAANTMGMMKVRGLCYTAMVFLNYMAREGIERSLPGGANVVDRHFSNRKEAPSKPFIEPVAKLI